MVQLAVAGRKQNNIKLTIGVDSVEKQVSHAEFVASTGQAWQGGTPDAVLEDVDYVCNITAIQAWDEPTSFVRWCFEHNGEQVDVEYMPHADDATFKLYATLTVPHLNIGGKTNQRNESAMVFKSTEPSTVAPV